MVLKTSAGRPITCEDWDDLVDEDGFLARGRNRYHCNYIVYTDGTYYYAENGATGNLDFGGPNNIGVAGNNAALVINAALAALPADGGKVQVKSGSYTISTPILITRGGITFIGELGTQYQQTVELILADGVNDNVITVDTRALGTTMGIRIGYFYINGNSANQTAGDGIYLDGPSWSVLEEIEFHYIYQHAINFNGVAGGGTNQVIRFDGISIRGSVGGDALHLDGVTDSIIINCDLNATGRAIYASYGGNHYINNACYLSEYGIYIAVTADEGIIMGNRFSDNTVDGIFCQGDKMVITNNRTYNNGRDGVRITGGTNCVVGDNIALTNDESGFYITDDYNQVNDNQAMENGQHGIIVWDAEYAVIQGNMCMNNGQAGNYDGIHIHQSVDTCENIIIDGNVCCDDQGIGATQRNGIRINAAATDYLTIVNNICRGNSVAEFVNASTGTNNIIAFNEGYNPVVASTPAVGASPVTFGPYQYPAMIGVVGGTITSVTIRGQATGQVGAGTIVYYSLYPGDTCVIVYAVVPVVYLYPQ